MAMIERTGGSAGAGAPSGFRVEDRVGSADDPARAAEDGEIAALVWDAVDALGPRDAEVLDLTLRHAMTPAEVGMVVGVNRNAANQIVHRARNRLKDAVAARVLWRGGAPECGDLADALAAAGVDRFDADAVRVTAAHADACELCGRRRELRLDPAKLFAAVPLAGGPVLLKQEVAHALAADGVPMAGSQHAGSAGAGGGRTETGTATAAAPKPHRHRVRHAVVASLVALAVVVAGIVVFAETLDHGTTDLRGAEEDLAVVTGPPTTTRAPTATPSTAATATGSTVRALAPSTTLPRAGPPAATAPNATTPATAAPANPAPPTTAPPPPPTASASIAPATVPASTTYLRPAAPVLTWSTSGGASVTVSGPGLSATTATGSAPLCPNASSAVWSFCVPPSGTYVYVVRVRNASGVVVKTASASLKVG
jgi:hypothetical protein